MLKKKIFTPKREKLVKFKFKMGQTPPQWCLFLKIGDLFLKIGGIIFTIHPFLHTHTQNFCNWPYKKQLIGHFIRTMTEQLQGQIQNANHQGRHRSTRAGLRLHFNLTSFNFQRMFDYQIYKFISTNTPPLCVWKDQNRKSKFSM